jgi:hypothetical protein
MGHLVKTAAARAASILEAKGALRSEGDQGSTAE